MSGSNVQVLTLDQAESRGWNAMVAEHPLGSVYHHTAFGKVISETFRHTEPYFIALADRQGACIGGFAVSLVRSWLTGNRLVSLPWACYADPLVRSTAEFELLFREALEFFEQAKTSYIEIRTHDASNLVTETKLMTPVVDAKSHSLRVTDGLDILWDRFGRGPVKRPIKKAEANGLVVRVGKSEQDVISFYRIFVGHRRRLGLPPQRPEYFLNIWRHMVPYGLARFWLAQMGGELVGGLCCFTFKDKMFLSYIGVEESLHRFGIGQYLCWTAVRAASEEGLKIVDLGKTPAHSDGLLSYKRAWGGVETATSVFYYPRPMGVSSYEHDQKLSYRAMRAFWRMAPASLSGIASRFFYRHTG